VFSNKDIQSIAVPGLLGQVGNNVDREDIIGGDFDCHNFNRENKTRGDSYRYSLDRDKGFGANPGCGDFGR